MSRWNGHKAALSLTFDDGLTCQLDHAIPSMDAVGIKGTFFLATDCIQYPIDIPRWKKAVESGHEIGSHSITHKKAAQLHKHDMTLETQVSKRYLEEVFGQRVSSYCYPYTDAPADLQAAVGKAGYKQARGGRVARENKYIVPGDGVNLLNVPCYHVSGKVFEDESIWQWLLDAMDLEAWVGLMFHGVGPDGTQWDNVKSAEFCKLLDYLQAAGNSRKIWTAPFGTVAEYLRGLK